MNDIAPLILTTQDGHREKLRAGAELCMDEMPAAQAPSTQEMQIVSSPVYSFDAMQVILNQNQRLSRNCAGSETSLV